LKKFSLRIDPASFLIRCSLGLANCMSSFYLTNPVRSPIVEPLSIHILMFFFGQFNNILMTVLGNIDLAKVRLAAESPAMLHLKHIESAALKAADLATQMLAYSGKGKFVVEPLNLDRFATAVLKLLVTFDIGWALFNLIGVLDIWFSSWASKTESTLDDHLLPFVRKSLRAFVILMAIIMAIQNLGYSISGLLASLGIGGLAFALAAKDTLSNVFGSLMILLDRPFRIGDWIKAGDMEGTVEEIGFRSTKIRTFAKTLISVPNNVIANLPLDNFSRMPKRRIKLTIGVTYDTSAEQMAAAVEKIRELLRQHQAIDQDFWLVNFTDFGASSLDIMVYCFTTTTVWGDYLDARQDLNLKIMQLLEGMGLEIAFPSRTVYLQHQQGDMQPGSVE